MYHNNKTDFNNIESNKNADSNSIESKTSDIDSNSQANNTTLQILLHNSSLTILNYSLLEFSLNIKLEYTSKDTKEILKRDSNKRKRFFAYSSE